MVFLQNLILFNPIHKLMDNLREGRQIKCHQIETVFFHQIESFDYTRSKVLRVFTRLKFVLDQKFKKALFRHFKALLRLSIQCQKRTCNFFHQIKSFKSQKFHYQNFRSSAKKEIAAFFTRSNALLKLSIYCQKVWHQIECIIKTFDLVKSLKKFDLVKTKLLIQ